eukprot:SAG31_NODE_1048_length_10166_cov_4.708751_3_plen_121_part_00
MHSAPSESLSFKKLIWLMLVIQPLYKQLAKAMREGMVGWGFQWDREVGWQGEEKDIKESDGESPDGYKAWCAHNRQHKKSTAIAILKNCLFALVFVSSKDSSEMDLGYGCFCESRIRVAS